MTRCGFGIIVVLAAVCASFQPTGAATLGGDVTVLTMSHEGSWGVATDRSIDDALQNAIANCKKMSGFQIGCGGQVISMHNGWLLGYRCGTRNILASGATHSEAEELARRKEDEMRRVYVPDLPECQRVGAVDPNGIIVGPDGLALLIRKP